MLHNLKTEAPFFEASATCRKPFEIRKNDRDFSVGDTVVFICGERVLVGRIPYVLDDSRYLLPGFVAFTVDYNFHTPVLLVSCKYKGVEQELWIPKYSAVFDDMFIYETLEERISE